MSLSALEQLLITIANPTPTLQMIRLINLPELYEQLQPALDYQLMGEGSRVISARDAQLLDAIHELIKQDQRNCHAVS